MPDKFIVYSLKLCLFFKYIDGLNMNIYKSNYLSQIWQKYSNKHTMYFLFDIWISQSAQCRWHNTSIDHDLGDVYIVVHNWEYTLPQENTMKYHTHFVIQEYFPSYCSFFYHLPSGTLFFIDDTNLLKCYLQCFRKKCF